MIPDLDDLRMGCGHISVLKKKKGFPDLQSRAKERSRGGTTKVYPSINIRIIS